MELRTKKYNLWNIKGIVFSAFQILPIVILVSFLSFSCQGNNSKKINDTDTVKSKLIHELLFIMTLTGLCTKINVKNKILIYI